MGKVTARIMGNVSGKVGTIIWSKWKHVYIAKGLYNRKARKEGTPSLPQVSRLSLMSSFLTKYSDLVSVGFYKKSNKNTPWALAMKYNIANAIEKENNGYRINYPKIKMSDGNLEGAWGGKILFKPGQITISWQMSQLSNQKIIGKDKAQIMLYNETRDRMINYAVQPERSELESTHNAVGPYSGDIIHAWIFFVSPDGKMVSNSDYIGSGIVIGQPT